MKHTCITGENQNVGVGLKSFIVFGWGFLLVSTEQHSPAVPQVLKTVTTWTYSRLHNLGEEGFVCTAKFSLCSCKYWPNPRECLVEMLHLIKCKHFWENTRKKVLCGKGRNDWFNFFFLISLQIQEQTRKRLLVCSWTKKTIQNYTSYSVPENSFKFSFGKFLPCAVTVRSVDSSWHLSMDWYVTFLCCKH